MPDAADDVIDESRQEHVAEDENNCEIHGLLLSCQRHRSTFTSASILDCSIILMIGDAVTLCKARATRSPHRLAMVRRATAHAAQYRSHQRFSERCKHQLRQHLEPFTIRTHKALIEMDRSCCLSAMRVAVSQPVFPAELTRILTCRKPITFTKRRKRHDSARTGTRIQAAQLRY